MFRDSLFLGCSSFLSRSDGGSCPYRESRQNETQSSIYISVSNSLTSERAFFVTKLPSAIPNFFLPNRDRALFGVDVRHTVPGLAQQNFEIGMSHTYES